MEISILKTMAQHVIHNPPVSNITEEDIDYYNLEFQLKCDKCDISVHRKRRKKNSRRATQKVKIGNEEIENVLEFEYLGANVPNDGDPEVPITHRCNIAWGRFG